FLYSETRPERTQCLDIDGLRAQAMLSVVLFHAGSTFLTGGYVGVDAFFVISGFLITSIICRNVDSHEIQFRGYGVSRKKRPQSISERSTGQEDVNERRKRVKIKKRAEMSLAAGRRNPSGNILLIEDDVDIRTILKDALEWEGYRVYTASNGKE